MRSPDIDLTTAAWRKSSYSEGGASNCVEVAHGYPDTVPVRDSKDPHGPALLIPTTSWTHFLTAVRDGEFGDV